ncbi:hypothetical protein D3C72_965270 [compost metagenome]
MQRFEGTVRALFGIAAQRFEVAQVGRKIGQHRHVGDVCAGREIVAGIGIQNGFGSLPRRFDDIFIVRRHVVFDRRHTGVEFRRHACRLHLHRLADQRGEMGDLVFEAGQRMAVGGRGVGGLVQAGGNIAEPLFQTRKGAFAEPGCGLRLAVTIIEVLDPARERIEPFGQTVIDDAVIQRIDLAGNVAEERCQFRLLRGALRTLQKQGELVQPLVQLGGVAGGAELIDLAGQRFKTRGEIECRFRLGGGKAVDVAELFGKAVQPGFQPLRQRIVRCLRIRARAGGGNGAADFIQPLVETGKLLAKGGLVRLHMLAELLHGAGNRDQLVFEHAHGRIVAHTAKLSLDVIKTIGERNDLILQRAGVETA